MVATGDGAMDYIGKQSITQLNIDSILVRHFWHYACFAIVIDVIFDFVQTHFGTFIQAKSGLCRNSESSLQERISFSPNLPINYSD